MSIDLATLARRWARELPREFAYDLAGALRAGPAALKALRTKAIGPQSGAAVQTALQLADSGDGPFTGGLLAGRLDAQNDQPTVTPVWTGPQSAAGKGRLTLAVLADLISEAEHEIILVSYATIPSEDVRNALLAAGARDVEITLLLERHEDNVQFKGYGDPFPGLVARRLNWPGTSRPAGASMHAKILVVDRRLALVGSANLTGYGLERNLECGVLIRNGKVPVSLAEHLLTLSDLHPL